MNQGYTKSQGKIKAKRIVIKINDKIILDNKIHHCKIGNPLNKLQIQGPTRTNSHIKSFTKQFAYEFTNSNALSYTKAA